MAWKGPELASRYVQRKLKLGPPPSRELAVTRDLRVPMPDGVELLADRWAPASGGDGLPVALLRTPYGRGLLAAAPFARPLAERGYQVILQSARGTYGSGGVFVPFRDERADGRATLDWIIRQPWFGDSIVLVGPSYLGYAQWAVAGDLPPEVKAMIPNNTESALSLEFLRPDGFALEEPFGFGIEIDGQERRGAWIRQLTAGRRASRWLRTLPLSQADAAAVGHPVPYFQDALAHDADDPYWSPGDHRDAVAKVTIPVSSVGGWYDIFLPGQLRDFGVLQSLGRPARLTIGPWTHAVLPEAPFTEALGFGLACARDEEPPARAPVRLYVMGEDAWRDFAAWPPPGYPPVPYYLAGGGELATTVPGTDETDHYRYDPADPTPGVGGVRMTPRGGGRVDNAKLEARSDVLTYTTPPLTADTEVIGEVSADIWLSSTAASADVFVRLCDVDTEGRSWNICDGLTTLSGLADGPRRASVTLWATAYRFKRGHRIRVQVSSGAFPRYARNPGTGEPLRTAVRLVVADQLVHHGPGYPSAVILPVKEAG
jgi:hypothetical protein